MMLFRLSQFSPAAVARRFDDITPLLAKTMKGATVNKDTIKQDLERASELRRRNGTSMATAARNSSTGIFYFYIPFYLLTLIHLHLFCDHSTYVNHHLAHEIIF